MPSSRGIIINTGSVKMSDLMDPQSSTKTEEDVKLEEKVKTDTRNQHNNQILQQINNPMPTPQEIEQ